MLRDYGHTRESMLRVPRARARAREGTVGGTARGAAEARGL
jgi:hypothetical protein